MKIYFSGSISGGRTDARVYLDIVQHLQSKSCVVLSEHVAKEELLAIYSAVAPERIFTRDIHLIQNCDRVVAEVSTPSLGVGYEICYALFHDKPVLCLYREGIPLSNMILGNNHPKITVCCYSNDNIMRSVLDMFIFDDVVKGK